MITEKSCGAIVFTKENERKVPKRKQKQPCVKYWRKPACRFIWLTVFEQKINTPLFVIMKQD